MITIRQIIEVASSVFNVPYAEIIGSSRIEEHIIARHCVKAFASNMGYAPTQISAVMGGDRTTCLLYTSDAADDLLCVDLGGRRIIQKKKKIQNTKAETTSDIHKRDHE